MTFSRALRSFSSRTALGPVDDAGVLQVIDDLAGQGFRRGDQVGQTGIDGAAGHAVELGRGRLLHQHHAGFFLDGPQADGAVRAHAGEDDADAQLLPVLGQGAQEEIDGEAQAAGRRRFEQVQHPVQDRHVLVGGDHVDAVRLDLHPVLDLDNLHGGDALEEFGHDPLVGRVEMLDDDARPGRSPPARAAGTAPAPPARRRRRRCRRSGRGDSPAPATPRWGQHPPDHWRRVPTAAVFS